MIVPVRERPTSENNSPITAIGMLSQLSQPRKGSMPRSMKNKERRLMITPGIAIIVRIVVMVL